MSNELPLYQCHKQVRAAKIISMSPAPRGRVGSRLSLELTHGKASRIVEMDVAWDWVQRFMPEVGGYFVQYEDGYTSYSPAKAFEAGYSLVQD